MRATVFLGLALSFLPFSSEAARMRGFTVGAWTAGAYSNDSTKKFSHCAGSARYNSGIFVTLMVNREYSWGVGFSHPEWNLDPGSKIELGYMVDAGEIRSTTGTAISNQQVLIGFGGSADRFKEFSRGRELRVAAAKKVFTFNLTDTSKLLPALLDCVARQLNPAPAVASTTNTKSAASGNHRAEAAVIAANLLSQAGITGFRLATAEELPDVKADVIWIASDVVGTINVFPSISTKDLDEVRSIVIGGDAKGCKGTFFSGSVPDDGKENQLTRVFTTCQVKDASSTSYYLAVPRKAGGVYILRTMTAAGSEKPAKEADASIRKAVFTAIPK